MIQFLLLKKETEEAFMCTYGNKGHDTILESYAHSSQRFKGDKRS